MKIRRWLPYAAAFLLLFILFTVNLPARAENLLLNGDFSELDEDGLPEYWYPDAYVIDEGYTLYKAAEGDAEHPHAAVIQNIGENDARFAQTVKVEPDSLYLLSGYILAEGVEGGHGANLSIEGLYDFSEKLYDTEGAWQRIEYYGETGPDQENITVFARLGGYSGESKGKAYFSDISLTRVDALPDDVSAAQWYRADDDYYDDEDEYDDDLTDDSDGFFRKWFILMIILYTAAAVWIMYRQRTRKNLVRDGRENHRAVAAVILLLGLALRMYISWLVEGYLVDVNCFLSWGGTMASVGPAWFYQQTSFCDYPPLYTYILAFNSIITGALGGSDQIARVVFRFIPSVCDLAGCLLVYGLLIRREDINHRTSLVFLAFAAFNPATILNSAAWGQMDSVLCLLLLAVAVCAVSNRWKTALPLYVIAVLVKPQALMLGPLGLIYLIMVFVRKPENRKALMIGAGISVAVLAAGMIPFGIHQEWDWLIQLYIRTLGSYPYATVNTANFHYLMGGNWSAVGGDAPVAVFIILAALCGLYGYAWHRRSGNQRYRHTETVISILFCIVFIVFAALAVLRYIQETAAETMTEGIPVQTGLQLQPSWAWAGGLAMAFAFVIVISHALRSGKLAFLPWLGGLLFILLYVFGVKMHERYVFPALLLLCAAWAFLRDRRILYVALLFSMTLFLNEGIVLDNSILLGSKMGHLNNDTVWIADIISAVNIIGSLYAVWLSFEMLDPREKKSKAEGEAHSPLTWQPDRKLHWNRKDTLFVTLITLIYTAISLSTLGSTKAPQTYWTSSSDTEQVVFDLGEPCSNIEVLYFAQVSRHEFTIASSMDGENWSEETDAQMDEGQCWKWKYVTESRINSQGEKEFYNDEMYIIRFRGRYIRLTANQFGLRLNEILFRDPDGNILPARIAERTGGEPESALYSDPQALLDEQDTLEGLPSIPGEYAGSLKAQPSWWNSTYFDEIYHARTAYEFLQGSVPYETSHPPLGKVIMSAFVAIFGMTPFGWRFAGALAGILMLPGMYLLGKQLTKKTGMGILACLVMALDCMHLTQTQIATIDSFPVLFIIFAYFFMLRFLQTDFIREKTSKSLFSLGFSGLFMGLSIASKWIGIYAGAGLAVLFFWHCVRTVMVYRKAERMKADDAVSAENRTKLGQMCSAAGAKAVPEKLILLFAWCILFFIIIPVAIYLLSYIPYMAYNSRKIDSLWKYIDEVWQAQVGMINYHSKPGLGMDHPSYSPWWEWPLIERPMYYAAHQYLPDDSPVFHSIFSFGNPAVWIGGLAAVFLCAVRAMASRRYQTKESDLLWHMKSTTYDPRYAFIIIGLLAQFLPWILVPRGTYIYHYFASVPFLISATAVCLDFRSRYAKWAATAAAVIFAITAACFFIVLFPYVSGMNVSPEWLDMGRRILKIWY